MKTLWNENKTVIILAILDFVLVAVTGFYFGCKVWQMVPLWVSVVIKLMQTKVSRYAFIVGGCNSVWYAVVFAVQGLYATAAYTLLFSTSLQFISFWNWNRRAYKNSTYLRKMSGRNRVLCGVGLVIIWVVVFTIFSIGGSPYIILDNTVSVLGICNSLLLMFSYIEGYALGLVGQACNVWMYIQVIADKPNQMPYLASGVYGIIFSVISMLNAYKLYNRQQEDGVKLYV